MALPAGLSAIGKRAFAETGIEKQRMHGGITKISGDSFPEGTMILIQGSDTETQKKVEGLYDYIAYSTDGTTSSICRYRSHGDILYVPEEIDGNPISAFDEKAFEKGKRITADLGGNVAALLTAAGITVYSPFYPEMAMEKEPQAEGGEAKVVLIRYEGEKQHISIPYGVQGIRAGAFEGKNDLKSIRIPDTVEWIEEGAMSGLESVENVYIWGGLIDIPRNALPKNAYCWCEE